ncbi:hypothetical protein [Pelagibacterium xiamenense]|uniref:hypothetical protein n=1 Tax=Pelagibacterium xiamenense TaxID=2901140 RepID=UPI001E579767|nr:hypothetical protein [Pelagibacterium xiamenense]MCD7061158.1 hypothetical protein [Pelagibacterium xiamenense]
MKLTWFAGMTFRLHIAGEIVVTDPEDAPETVDSTELKSGADWVVHSLGSGLAGFDPEVWKPRRAGRLIDADTSTPKLNVFRFGRGFVLDAPDEGLVVVLDSDAPADIVWGRWADNAIVVLGGGAAGAVGRAALEGARPKLIALAGAGAEADAAFATLAPLVGSAGLTVLEPGLAVEV